MSGDACDAALAAETATVGVALTGWLAGPKDVPFVAEWGRPWQSRAATLAPGWLVVLALLVARRLRTRVDVDAATRTVAVRRGLGRPEVILLAEIRSTSVATRSLGPLLVARPMLTLADKRRVPLWPMPLPGAARALRDRESVAALLNPFLADPARLNAIEFSYRT